ncbi:MULTISPECIES: ABC transporter permease subunit [unclassified Streptomyces]|uniref:ABC transporter permease subunit n=1 Tax=unclassified Streptomyces TaxID=2593676 RepID=UPI0038229236
MTWLVWRQHRTAFWTVSAGTAALVGYCLLGRYGAADAIAQQLNGCTGPVAELSRHCAEAVPAFQQEHQSPLRTPLRALVLLPLVVGAFLGATLFAQELESGTYRTALSQSVTRTRWFLAKLAVPTVITVLFSGLITAAATWWWHTVSVPLGSALPWYRWMPYDAIGPAPVAKTLLMLMIGVACGLLIRRTVAAMGATVLLGAGLLFTLENVRGALWPAAFAQHQDAATQAAPDGAWVLGQGLLTSSGQRVGQVDECFAADNYQQCLTQHGVTGQWAEYHPTSHLWPLQWMETGVCLAAAAALGIFCFWWTRRRLT